MVSQDDLENFNTFLSSNQSAKLVITTHRKADMDGLSCAYSLHQIFPKSIIAVDDLDEGAKGLADFLGIQTHPIRELDKHKYAGLVVVDTASYTLLESAREWQIKLVIDHHHPQGRDMKTERMIVDDHSPSAAQMIAALMPPSSINKDVAFALSIGIISDTARFKSSSADTFEILGRLMKICGASYLELLEIADPEHRSDVKAAILKAMQRVNFVYVDNILVATSEVSSNESDAAQVISEAADVAFVASWKDKEMETRISARARKSCPIELNEVMKEVGVSLGGNGGGHPKAAGASVKVHTPEALKACLDKMIEKMNDLKGAGLGEMGGV